MEDCFLRLPETLIHHILSLLPFKEIGRTCVLSKYWNIIWCNYPNLDFTLTSKFRKWILEDQHVLDENLFFQSLVRKPCIQKLCLIIWETDFSTLTRILVRCLRLSLDKNVSEVVLYIAILRLHYVVPDQLLIGRTLKVLDLFAFQFEEDRFVHIDLPLLKKLSVSNCRFVGDNLLHKILHASPKLEHIAILKCHGTGRSLCISGKPFLKYIFLMDCNEIERIKINAPSLHTFSYESRLVGTVNIDLEQFLSTIIGFQFLKLSTYQSFRKLKFSATGKDVDNSHGGFEVEYSCPCRIVPEADIYVMFSANSFVGACRNGLKHLLMKLHNYKDLKLVISHTSYNNYGIFMSDNLHHVSFSGIPELTRKLSMKNISISREEISLLAREITLSYVSHRNDVTTLSIFSSSMESIESVHEKLNNHPIIQRAKACRHRFKFEIKTSEDADDEMGDVCKALIEPDSIGVYHSMKIIFDKCN